MIETNSVFGLVAADSLSTTKSADQIRYRIHEMTLDSPKVGGFKVELPFLLIPAIDNPTSIPFYTGTPHIVEATTNGVAVLKRGKHQQPNPLQSLPRTSFQRP